MYRIVLFLLDGVRVSATVALLAAVRVYQRLVGPWLPNACRFDPTCSHYAVLAIKRYGPVRGSAKAILRIARCHPWSAGGWDPP
ncbi:membrane protein insertion efficiency factor YidD [Botrimarina sp.]|uniref:membrane protein insertion efficiency factor YidD n=1 Tax=Botrimarina sp. TaxID=2795802 RepID=UPI0032EFE910